VPTLNPNKLTDEPFSSVVEIPRKLQIVTGVFKGFFDTSQAEDISLSPIGHATTNQQQETNNIVTQNPAMQNHLYQDPNTSQEIEIQTPHQDGYPIQATAQHTNPIALQPFNEHTLKKTLKRKPMSGKHSSASHTNQVKYQKVNKIKIRTKPRYSSLCAFGVVLQSELEF